MSGAGLGWLGVATTVVAWGVYMVPMRSPAVVRANVHPFVEQAIVSLAIGASSLLLLIVERSPVFTAWGLVGAALWSVGNICAIYAVGSLQLGVAQSLWSGGIAVISFCWGYFAPMLWSGGDSHTRGCRLSNRVGAFGGLALLVLGLAGVVMSATKQPPPPPQQEQSPSTNASQTRSAAECVRRVLSAAGCARARSLCRGSGGGSVSTRKRANSPSSPREALLSTTGSMFADYDSRVTVAPISPDKASTSTSTSTPSTPLSTAPPPRLVYERFEVEGAYAALGDTEAAQRAVREREARALASGRSLTPAEFACRRATGLLQALLAALLIGSHLVPLKLATRTLSDADPLGVTTLPSVTGYALSFALGTVVTSFALLCALLLWRIVHAELVLQCGFTGWLAIAQRHSLPLYRSWIEMERIVPLLCATSGLLWNVGSIGTLVSALSPLGLTVGYPVSQCAVLVSAVTALVCFRELQQPTRIVAFLASVCVAAGGAALLGVFGACVADR